MFARANGAIAVCLAFSVRRDSLSVNASLLPNPLIEQEIVRDCSLFPFLFGGEFFLFHNDTSLEYSFRKACSLTYDLYERNLQKKKVFD